MNINSNYILTFMRNVNNPEKKASYTQKDFDQLVYPLRNAILYEVKRLRQFDKEDLRTIKKGIKLLREKSSNPDTFNELLNLFRIKVQDKQSGTDSLAKLDPLYLAVLGGNVEVVRNIFNSGRTANLVYERSINLLEAYNRCALEKRSPEILQLIFQNKSLGLPYKILRPELKALLEHNDKKEMEILVSHLREFDYTPAERENITTALFKTKQAEFICRCIEQHIPLSFSRENCPWTLFFNEKRYDLLQRLVLSPHRPIFLLNFTGEDFTQSFVGKALGEKDDRTATLFFDAGAKINLTNNVFSEIYYTDRKSYKWIINRVCDQVKNLNKTLPYWI